MTAVATVPESSGNPALKSDAAAALFAQTSERSMTVLGTTLKLFVLLIALVAGGSWGWSSATTSVPRTRAPSSCSASSRR